ncbi:ABC transporter permease [Nakamurella endophytica]|uniref:Peptide ABC transporter n=1 Tax=Nakamurella endophytica TaxID=1748367 RepID=A0A917SQF9_9ACTN|nr:ABC transporter permease [Nakamurella endophytica]GGL93585.1 peptide ABC transporter [Nakamurella endophytica]
MAWQIVRRLLIFVGSVLVASLAVFWLLSGIGDPARVQLGTGATEEGVRQLREQMGLNRPFFTRYLEWLGGTLHGDFGSSYISHAAIGPQLADRLSVTLWLVLGAMVLSVVVALPLGMLAALWHRRWAGTLISGITQLGVAVPAFLVGILLIALFAVRLGWLPSGSYVVPAQDPGGFLEHMILPWLSLGLVQAAVLTRYVRTAVLDQMGQDYLRTARAKGLTPWQALLRHGLRNAAIPVLTVLGVQLVTILVGAVVVEQVFVIPGIGQWLVDSVGNQDLLTVQAIVITLVAIALAVSFVVDVLYTLVDPRLRHG